MTTHPSAQTSHRTFSTLTKDRATTDLTVRGHAVVSAPANKITGPKTAASAIRVSSEKKALGFGKEEKGREIKPGCLGKVCSLLPYGRVLYGRTFARGRCDANENGVARAEEVQAAAGSEAKDLK